MENKVEITKQEARDLVERCLKVLYYRDARSYNRVSSAECHRAAAISRHRSIISVLFRQKCETLSGSSFLHEDVLLTFLGHLFVFSTNNLTVSVCAVLQEIKHLKLNFRMNLFY